MFNYNWEFYLNNNKDLKKALKFNLFTALHHWDKHGQHENRKVILELFDWNFYKDNVKKKLNINLKNKRQAYLHWITVGKKKKISCHNYKVPKNRLKFIHITKTGGTSIENLGMINGYRWGRFDLNYGWWHGIFKKLDLKKRLNYDWFLVVRNPYTRIISEFHCSWGGHNNIKNCNKKDFNMFIKNKLKNIDLVRGNHYTPQYLYIDKLSNINILKFENLYEDFNNLMKKYNIKIKLDIHSNKNKKKFGVKHLNKENINLIQKIYMQDFIKFNYSFDIMDI